MGDDVNVKPVGSKVGRSVKECCPCSSLSLHNGPVFYSLV